MVARKKLRKPGKNKKAVSLAKGSGLGQDSSLVDPRLSNNLTGIAQGFPQRRGRFEGVVID
jgi:hypothetical protein